MQLHGLSKLTLLDYPEHLACTAFTATCNFRCPFCHNAPLVLSPSYCQTINEEEFFAFLSSRKGRLEGICITGGEPTLQADLVPFIKKIKDLGYLVKLDTNGYRPEILSTLLSEHLVDMVAMDIKNSKERYAATSGIAEDAFDIHHIEESIHLLLSSDITHEFRTTVVKELHNKEAIHAIGIWLKELSYQSTGLEYLPSPYFLQSFQDSGNLVCGTNACFHPPTLEMLQDFITILRPFIPKVQLRGK